MTSLDVPDLLRLAEEAREARKRGDRDAERDAHAAIGRIITRPGARHPDVTETPPVARQGRT